MSVFLSWVTALCFLLPGPGIAVALYEERMSKINSINSERKPRRVVSNEH